MQYAQYGRTGKNVSAVGFGGMRFDTSKSPEENAELLLHAQEKGINYFDTAPGYCSDQSETIFGIALSKMKGEVYVSTKAMPVDYDTKDKIKTQVRKSLDRLKVDQIDFFHIWCLRKMEHYELAMAPGGEYDGLLELQQEGLVGHIVCSSHQPGGDIRKIVEDGKVEGLLIGINILNFPYRWDGVQAARKAGVGVVAMNPLGGGAIPTHEKELAFLASSGETPTDAALRFAINCPDIDIALPGFTTHEHIDHACRIADEARTFTPEEMDRVRKHIGENMNEACTGCGYCKDCPKNIPIPSYMQFYNEKAVFGKSDAEMKKQLGFQHSWGLLVGAEAWADECIECGRCEEDCTQHLPIIERLKEIAEWEKDMRK